MNTIKAALIDDGVHIGMDTVFAKINRCYAKKGILYQGSTGVTDSMSHGTICAAVLASIDTNIELFDIKVFEEDGAEMTDLIAALEYCLLCGVQVINLSCGTLNYLEYKKVKQTLKKLQRRNVMIVSAFSNQGIRSFPAVCRGVFGVRIDCSGALKAGEYGFQEMLDGRPENNIVAQAGTVKIGGYAMETAANSFAAPIITGNIVKILKENPCFHFRQVLRYLLSHAKSEPCQGREIKKILSCEEDEIDTPVIGIEKNCRRVKKFLEKKLIKEGYSVAVISENAYGKTQIPSKWYMGKKGGLNTDIVYTVDQIYRPDVIIFSLNSQRFQPVNGANTIDIMLYKKHGRYYMETEEGTVSFHRYQDTFAYILHYFAE